MLVVGTAHAQALGRARRAVWGGACSAGPAACGLWRGMLWCVVCQPHPRPSRPHVQTIELVQKEQQRSPRVWRSIQC